VPLAPKDPITVPIDFRDQTFDTSVRVISKEPPTQRRYPVRYDSSPGGGLVACAPIALLHQPSKRWSRPPTDLASLGLPAYGH